MCNMKALSLIVRKLWPRLNFFQKYVKLQGQEVKITKLLFEMQDSFTFNTNNSMFSGKNIYIYI